MVSKVFKDSAPPCNPMCDHPCEPVSRVGECECEMTCNSLTSTEPRERPWVKDVLDIALVLLGVVAATLVTLWVDFRGQK